MKADVTFSQLYWNHSLMNFFFRTQSEKTLNELLDRANDRKTAVERIDEYAEENYDDLDELEELFYEDTVETIADLMGIELQEEEENDEDEN